MSSAKFSGMSSAEFPAVSTAMSPVCAGGRGSKSGAETDLGQPSLISAERDAMRLPCLVDSLLALTESTLISRAKVAEAVLGRVTS